MTYEEVEDILDGYALLKKDGEIYEYCDTPADLIRETRIKAFQNTRTGEEIGLTYSELRDNDELSAIY